MAQSAVKEGSGASAAATAPSATGRGMHPQRRTSQQRLQQVLLACLTGPAVLAAQPCQATPVAFQTTLAAELQPLRGSVDRPEWFAAELKPILRAYQRKQWGKACAQSDGQLKGLMLTASRLFFGSERKKAETEAIERFLDAKVRGTTPVLEVAAEGFAPAAPWRSLAVDACIRAEQPEAAVAQIQMIASAAGDGPALVALAVARAQADRNWSSAAAVVAKSKDALRVLLIRALAQPAEAGHWLAAAEKWLQTGEDQKLLASVRRACGQP